MTLQDFVDHDIARKADLSQAEVAVLRLYTGPFYTPWNTALRRCKQNPHLLESWGTSISVLYNAVFKLSLLIPRKRLFTEASMSPKGNFPTAFCHCIATMTYLAELSWLL